MMNYKSRLSLAVVLGMAAAVIIDHFYGDLYQWLLICVAASIATETAQRTLGSKSLSSNRKRVSRNGSFDSKKQLEKPPNFKF
ncbi:MAG: hypothetical protein PHW95_03605 [Patescibacteria group bacterium]|nr:hypothetical protein [Patescibacteria group bacterium]